MAIELTSWDKFLLWWGSRQHQAACGHMTPKRFVILSLEGDKVMYHHRKVPADWCPVCIQQAVIQCAWCGRSILPGDPITLYTPLRKDFSPPDYAVVYSQDPLLLVGCGRPDCAETGADYGGIWVPPGKVERFLSMTEQAMVMAQNDIDCAVVGDPSDVNSMIRASNELINRVNNQ